jgi:hypothetical protein
MYSKFLNSKLAGAMCVAIAVLGMFAPVFYDMDAIAPMMLAAKFLGIPIAAFLLYLSLFKGPPDSAGNRIVLCFLALLATLFLVVVSSGYIVLANAWGPWQRETLVQGRIVSLRDTGYKVRRHEVAIVDASGRRIYLDVDWAEYHQLSVGDTYSQRWKIGTLGILYK